MASDEQTRPRDEARDKPRNEARAEARAGAAGRDDGPAPRAARPALVSESQVEAAISLLGDASDKVVDACRAALRNHAEIAEPLLRERLGEAQGEEAEAVHAALVDIVGGRLEAPLVDHLVHKPSLEEGSVLIGRIIDATEQPGAVTAALDAMADQVVSELSGERDPGRELAAMTDVLVRRHGLRGTDPAKADAWDAVLHGVTQRRRGLPLPLCMTWILVARRAGIPIDGINMPGHFLVRYRRGDHVVVLDPFHAGRAVREEECRRYLAAAGYPAIDVETLDAADRDMLMRTLRNLVMIASRRRERELAARCARILNKTSSLTGT